MIEARACEGCIQPNESELINLVYDELKSAAAQFLRRERVDHSLAPTALAHEAILRVCTQESASWTDRKHFLAVSIRALRQVLINHSQSRTAAKRGGQRRRVEIRENDIAVNEDLIEMVDVHEALGRLEQVDERCAKIIELRYFGGLSVTETARVVGVAPRTVEADWTFGKAWLRRELERPERQPA